MLERFDGNWTFRGHANSRTDDSRTCQFADTPIRGLWTIRGKTLSGQAGLFADRLFEVTALPVASSRQAGARCLVAVPTTCCYLLLIMRLWTNFKFINKN